MSTAAPALAPMIWRIYRMPGDREFWRIDHGPGSSLLWAKTILFSGPVKTVDDKSGAQPRAWLETTGTLHLTNEGSARFE